MVGVACDRRLLRPFCLGLNALVLSYSGMVHAERALPSDDPTTAIAADAADVSGAASAAAAALPHGVNADPAPENAAAAPQLGSESVATAQVTPSRGAEPPVTTTLDSVGSRGDDSMSHQSAEVSQAAPSAPATPTPAVSWEVKPFAFLRLSGHLSGRELRDSALDTLLGTAGIRVVSTPWLSWTLSAVGEASAVDKSQLRTLDAIGAVRIANELQFLAGRFVVPFDRFNLSGPYRTLVWSYPGFYNDAKLIGAESGPVGRSTGVGVWGSILDGTLKYYAMAHEVEVKRRRPRLTSRLALSLLDREPEYTVSSTYLGTRDVFALGVAGQFQDDGRVTTLAEDGSVADTANLWALVADAFLEKTWAGFGTLTLDAAYYRYDEDRPYDAGYQATLGYAPPLRLGDGVPQLGVRWQSAHANADVTAARDVSGADVTLAYGVPQKGVRLAIDYSRQTLGDASVQTRVYLGMQCSFF